MDPLNPKRDLWGNSDNQGKKYEQYRPPYAAFQIDLVKSLLCEHPQNYLDIGCGTGKVFFEFEPLVSGYRVGIDISPSMIQTIKSRVEEVERLKNDPKLMM
jgi:ubiquinone/menaquinone biosynthesis C-methylase UbiE